jgi:UDPglucose 6-dehydrogenase
MHDVNPARSELSNNTVVYPHGSKEGEALLPGDTWMADLYAAAERADCLLILTERKQFRALDLRRLAGLMASPRA